MKKILVSAFALMMGALVSNVAMATVPDLIPIQGVLADDVGAPIDGPTDIAFALYAAETGGTALWTDAFADIDVVEGFFTVYLGSDTALDLTAYLSNPEIWLGINVEGDGEMDRIQLATVPFAIQAQVCQAVGSLTESDINTNFAPSAHNHDAAYAPITHTHAWADITSGMPAGFSDGVDNDTDTTYTAGAGLTLTGTTFSIPAAGVTSAMVADGAGSGLDADLLDGQHGSYYLDGGASGSGSSQSAWAALTSGDNYVFGSSSITPSSNGVCLVVAQLECRTSNTGTSTYVRTAMRAGAVNSYDGLWGPYLQANELHTDITTSHVYAVSAGTTYQFGCYVSASGDWVGDNVNCRSSVLCL